MMVKMKNRLTGSTMWVAENRVEEYKAAGHKLAASAIPREPKAEVPAEEKPRKHKK